MTPPEPAQVYERDGRKRRVVEVLYRVVTDQDYVVYARRGVLYECSLRAWRRWAEGAVRR